jgi:hypothetical protein
MGRIEGWFPGFVERHTDRFPRSDWPPPDSEFWRGLLGLFVRHGVTEELADVSSQMMMESPPDYVDKHPGMLISRIRSAQRELADAAPKSTAPPRDPENFDARAEVAWALIDEPTREHWRNEVRRRMPLFAKWGSAAEKVAKAWNYDPSYVTAEPEPNPSPEGAGSSGGSNPFRERKE